MQVCEGAAVSVLTQYADQWRTRQDSKEHFGSIKVLNPLADYLMFSNCPACSLRWVKRGGKPKTAPTFAQREKLCRAVACCVACIAQNILIASLVPLLRNTAIHSKAV